MAKKIKNTTKETKGRLIKKVIHICSLVKTLNDKAANLVYKTDDFMDSVGPAFSKQGKKISTFAAKIITKHDNIQARIQRRLFIIVYYIAKEFHKLREILLINKKKTLMHFGGGVLIAIAIVALFDYSTGYEYSYHGRVMGIVQNQEDVLKVLDLVSDQLSEQSNCNIEIDKNTDITFKNVVSINKDVDDADMVLKKMTYMTDMQANAYAIYVDGNLEVILENKAMAEKVLEDVKNNYLANNKKTTYESVGFAENIVIKEHKTKISNISSESNATKKIIAGKMGKVVYKVKSGDTVSGICSKYDIPLKKLKELNSNSNLKIIHIGQEITISQAMPSLTVKTVEVSTYAEGIKYKVTYKKTSGLYEGETSVNRSGKNGKRIVTARITKENGNEVAKTVLETKIIKEAVTKIVYKGTKPLPPKKGTGVFAYPVSGYVLTSNFGRRAWEFHQGVDLACPTGTTIRASDGGTVTFAGYSGAYGYLIKIDHGDGFATWYAHCSRISVSAGQKVYKGQSIGAVGSTGRSTGPHLHFQVMKNGTAVNPLRYL